MARLGFLFDSLIGNHDFLTFSLIIQLNYIADIFELRQLVDFNAAKRNTQLHFFMLMIKQNEDAASFERLCVPVVTAGSSLVYCWRDGHTVETIFVVVSLVELLTNLLDVSGNNHKVSVGEANEYIPITKPVCDSGRKKSNFKQNITYNLASVLGRVVCPYVCAVPAVGHNVSIAMLKSQIYPVFRVVDIEKHQYLLAHRHTHLKVDFNVISIR